MIDALREYREVNLYLRGIIPLVGFRWTIVEYERKERIAGTSKYSIKDMVKLALDGITSFSTVPLQIITILGFIVFAGIVRILRLDTLGGSFHGSCCPRLGIDRPSYVFPWRRPATVPWCHRCIPRQSLRRSQIPTALLHRSHDWPFFPAAANSTN